MEIHSLYIFFAVLCGQYLLFKLMSAIEKIFIVKTDNTNKLIEDKSYYSFKIFRNIIIITSSIETILIGVCTNINHNTILFAILFLCGYCIRLISIYTLKEFWSYKIEHKQEHRLICNGIYKYLKHPAYIGNIYIPSLYFMLCLNVSGFISLIYIVAFYSYRAKIENRLLDELQK